jgi:hypothetical protein
MNGGGGGRGMPNARKTGGVGVGGGAVVELGGDLRAVYVSGKVGLTVMAEQYL